MLDCVALDLAGGGRGKRRGSASDDEDGEDEEGMGGDGLRASEVVRREMGLEWMLKSASTSQPEGSRAQRADDEEEKFEGAQEEVTILSSKPDDVHAYCIS